MNNRILHSKMKQAAFKSMENIHIHNLLYKSTQTNLLMYTKRMDKTENNEMESWWIQKISLSDENEEAKDNFLNLISIRIGLTWIRFLHFITARAKKKCNEDKQGKFRRWVSVPFSSTKRFEEPQDQFLEKSLYHFRLEFILATGEFFGVHGLSPPFLLFKLSGEAFSAAKWLLPKRKLISDVPPKPH